MNAKETNRCLNFIKGIACIGVIFIHVVFPTKIGELISTSARFAVPVFFMISGYYCSLNNIDTNRILRKANHIIKIFLLSILMYFMYAIINNIFNNKVNELISTIFSLKTILKILLLNNLSFLNAGHLWFLMALIYCYIMFIFINKFNLFKLAYYSIPILFICKIIITYYTNDWHYTDNFLFSGIPYFMLGNFIRKEKSRILVKVDNKQLIALGLVGLLFSELANFIYLRLNIFYIGTIIFSLSLFIFAQKNSQVCINNKIENIGVKYSLYIYVTHILFYLIINSVGNTFGIEANMMFLSLKPIIVTFITVVSGVVFYSIVNKLK